MKFLFVLLICIKGYSIYSQVLELDINQKANDFFEQRKFDSAFHYYKQLKDSGYYKIDSHFNLAYANNKIAACLLAVKDTADAIKYYLENFSLDSMNFGYKRYEQQLNSYFSFANIYHTRTDYRNTLVYLNEAKQFLSQTMDLSLFENKWIVSSSTRNKDKIERLKLQIAYSKAICYNSINEKDSILIELAPFMGRTTDPQMVRLFAKTVIELFGKVKVKEEFLKGLNNPIYLPKYTQDSLCSDCVFVSVECYIPFFNLRIELPAPPHSVLIKNTGEIPKDYTKEHLVNNFKKMPTYLILVEY